MDYDLSRIDYTICGITYPDTLRILPPSGTKLQQKVSKLVKVFCCVISIFYKMIKSSI